MKRYRVIMLCLFSLLLFAVVGSMFANADMNALINDPFNFFANNLSGGGIVLSAGLFSAAPLTWEDGSENMGGFRNYLYIIPINDIQTEATLPTNPSTSADFVTLTGNHTLVATKYWKKVYATSGTVKFTPENQGEIDGQSFKQKGAFLFPGSGDDVNAFARQVNNGNFVIILVEENGRRVQVGSKGHPARIKPSPDFGAAAADRKGFNFEFEADSFVAALRYNGTISLSESDSEPAIS